MCITFGNPSDPCCDDAPAAPLGGFIQRHMIPQPITDDVGLSNALWLNGVTGNAETNLNRTCLYHHFTTPNKRTTSVFNILQPLRWSIEAPRNAGDSWDHWEDVTAGGTSPHYKSGQLSSAGFGFVGVRDKLLPRDWHARFQGNLVWVKSPPTPAVCIRDFDVINVTGSESYLEQSLQAIAPTTPPWQIDGNSDTYPVTTQVYAFRHVVNGAPGKVFLGDDLENDANWFIRVAPNDTYQIDVWYRVGIDASILFSPSAGKGCVYWPLRRVTNGSRQRSSYLMAFDNVDFSPFYNATLQAFAMTIAGHTGWTFRDGSNGPHRLVPEEDWDAESGTGGAAVETDSVESFWSRIVFDFAREIPQVIFVPGPALKARHPAVSQAILYRATDNPDLYPERTNSADFGTVSHAGNGRLYQDGTTVFELVPWTVEGVPSESTAFFTLATGRADAASSPPSYREVPRRIILSRVSR
jgi:hypothetical protein